MANSANPEINKKIATSALGTLVIATVFFYLGDRYAETLVTYPGQIFDHLSDAFLSMWQTIKDAPFALDMTSNSLLFGGACFLIIWMIWLRYVAFIGNYRSGEESGSARWGTLKEGKKFKDLQTEDNNLLFTKNFGLALHRPKFDPEYDRNLNVLVVGGSGSGKTFNYVTPNICQLNTSYFVTDPKGTLLKDAGYLFTDNGYKLKSFNTINLDESMHYNPLKYVKTDTDILSFVNCFIMNTNPEGKSSGDPFWENAEKMLYTALISENEDEVNTLVEKAASERAARYAYDHPKLPKGFVTIEQLQGDLDLGDLRDEVEDFDFDGDITEAFGETAEYKVDDNATFEEKYGEDFADCADNFIQDNDDIAGRVNPCAMSVETVRAVYGMGFDAVFLNDWKKELAECDIDPEAVSVDSEAHDMENGRDGLDGNAPEKDAPEKDDRDAQPPVDTDNR